MYTFISLKQSDILRPLNWGFNPFHPSGKEVHKAQTPSPIVFDSEMPCKQTLNKSKVILARLFATKCYKSTSISQIPVDLTLQISLLMTQTQKQKDFSAELLRLQ